MAVSYEKGSLHRIFISLLVIVLIANVSASTENFSPELEEAIRTKQAQIIRLHAAAPRPQPQQKKTTQRLDIFCHDGEHKPDLKKMWSSKRVRILIASENYAVYKGSNESVVYREYQASMGSWISKLLPWKSEMISLDPFNRTCIGVDTLEEYSVQLQMKGSLSVVSVIDPWLVGYLLGGILLFFLADILSQNIIFYYGSGVSIGLIASLLILVFIMSRFVPKKTGAYAVLAVGWSVTAWLLQYIWENIQTVLEQYYVYVASYFGLAALISFAVCYYKGPPTNPRALNLIKWSIQLVAIVFMYNGTQIPEVSFTIIAIVILKSVLKIKFRFFRIPLGLKSIRMRFFRPQIRLLSREEYEKQGQEETQKALEELREYCRSPNCDAWKTISRMKSPSRFARWVEGDSHLSEEECNAYDNDPTALPEYNNFQDDEDELDFRLSLN